MRKPSTGFCAYIYARGPHAGTYCAAPAVAVLAYGQAGVGACPAHVGPLTLWLMEGALQVTVVRPDVWRQRRKHTADTREPTWGKGLRRSLSGCTFSS